MRLLLQPWESLLDGAMGRGSENRVLRTGVGSWVGGWGKEMEWRGVDGVAGVFPELCCSKPRGHPSGAEPRDLRLDRKGEGVEGSSKGCRPHPTPL